MPIGCSVRKDTASRFHTLIVAMATVKFTTSASEKCSRNASNSASGAPVSAIFVTASVQASSARSRAS